MNPLWQDAVDSRVVDACWTAIRHRAYKRAGLLTGV